MPNMTAQTVGTMVASRTKAGAGTIQPMIPLGGRAFSIRIQIKDSTSREVVVRLTDQPKQPYWILFHER
jgi:hypothetical protein